MPDKSDSTAPIIEVVVNMRNELNLNKFLYEVKLKRIKDSQLELQLEKFYSQRRSKVNNTRLSESFIANVSQNDTFVNEKDVCYM